MINEWEKDTSITNPYAWRKKDGSQKIRINNYHNNSTQVLIYTTRGPSADIRKNFKSKIKAIKWAKSHMRKF